MGGGTERDRQALSAFGCTTKMLLSPAEGNLILSSAGDIPILSPARGKTYLAAAGDKMRPDLARSGPELGAALRRRRRSLKLSQAQVAERAGVKQNTVSSAEAGGPGTKLQTLIDLMAVLELELVVQPRSSNKSTSIEDIF